MTDTAATTMTDTADPRVDVLAAAICTAPWDRLAEGWRTHWREQASELLARLDAAATSSPLDASDVTTNFADPSVDEETAEHLTVCGIVLRDCTAGELGLTPGSRK